MDSINLISWSKVYTNLFLWCIIELPCEKRGGGAVEKQKRKGKDYYPSDLKMKVMDFEKVLVKVRTFSKVKVNDFEAIPLYSTYISKANFAGTTGRPNNIGALLFKKTYHWNNFISQIPT